MIRPHRNNAFTQDAALARALQRAHSAAAERHANATLPLLQWQSGQMLTTDAVIAEIKEKKPAGGGDMDY